MTFKKMRISDFAKVQGGYAFKSSDFTIAGTPVLKITNVQDKCLDFSKLNYVNIVNDEMIKKFFVKNGDVLISMTGNGPHCDSALVGRVAKYKGLDDKYLLNQRVGRFIVDETKVRRSYLYYLISQPIVNKELASMSTGSANQANISGKTIESLELIVPDLKTQDKILDVLEAIDAKIEVNNQISETLEATANAVFKNWFLDFEPVKAKQNNKKSSIMDKEIEGLFPNSFEESEFGIIPKGWKFLQLNDCVSLIIDHRGKTPVKLGGAWSSFGVEAYSAKNIKGNRLVKLDDVKYLDESIYKKWMKEELNLYDIVMTSEAPMGEFLFLQEQVKWVLSQRLYAIRANEKVCTPQYLFQWLQTNNFLNDLNSRSSGTTVVGVRQSELRQVQVLWPGLKLTQSFKDITESMYKKIWINEKENLLLTQFRNILLPKLISGDFDLSLIKKVDHV